MTRAARLLLLCGKYFIFGNSYDNYRIVKFEKNDSFWYGETLFIFGFINELPTTGNW
jgi:hypothetical protein